MSTKHSTSSRAAAGGAATSTGGGAAAKPSSSSRASASAGAAAGGSSSKQQRTMDPMTTMLTPEVVWSHRPGGENDPALKEQQQQQQQQQQQHLTADQLRRQGSGRNAASSSRQAAAAAADSPEHDVTTPNNNNKQRSEAKRDSPQPQQSRTSAAQAAASRSQVVQQQAQQAAAAYKSSSTVLGEEVAALKEENMQLRDIEKQFWMLLDEREQLQEEVRNLQNGIRSAHSLSASNAASLAGSANLAARNPAAGASSSQLVARTPSDATEAEKNYNQMATALDEALTMLLQLDRTAASRLGPGSAASVVTPGTLIHRFLDFCSAERTGHHHHQHFSTSNTGNNNNNKDSNSNSSPANASFANRTAQMIHNMQQNLREGTPGVVGTPQQQNSSSATGGEGYHDHHNISSTLHASSMSQALRMAQDELKHLQLELDRSDLSRLQALDDVDKMQGQIKILSQSVVELRSAYASARAQADANARLAETAHDVTVRLAERDAEIAHLKARIAEMQRLAASGGSALASDTQRIRSELQARIAK